MVLHSPRYSFLAASFASSLYSFIRSLPGENVTFLFTLAKQYFHLFHAKPRKSIPPIERRLSPHSFRIRPIIYLHSRSGVRQPGKFHFFSLCAPARSPAVAIPKRAWDFSIWLQISLFKRRLFDDSQAYFDARWFSFDWWSKYYWQFDSSIVTPRMMPEWWRISFARQARQYLHAVYTRHAVADGMAIIFTLSSFSFSQIGFDAFKFFPMIFLSSPRRIAPSLKYFAFTLVFQSIDSFTDGPSHSYHNFSYLIFSHYYCYLRLVSIFGPISFMSFHYAGALMLLASITTMTRHFRRRYSISLAPYFEHFARHAHNIYHHA